MFRFCSLVVLLGRFSPFAKKGKIMFPNNSFSIEGFSCIGPVILTRQRHVACIPGKLCLLFALKSPRSIQCLRVLPVKPPPKPVWSRTALRARNEHSWRLFSGIIVSSYRIHTQTVRIYFIARFPRHVEMGRDLCCVDCELVRETSNDVKHVQWRWCQTRTFSPLGPLLNSVAAKMTTLLQHTFHRLRSHCLYECPLIDVQCLLVGLGWCNGRASKLAGRWYMWDICSVLGLKSMSRVCCFVVR